MLEHQTISILQYNVNNSRTQVMIPLFETEGIENYDILAIQEPWRNPFQTTINNRIGQHFELLYMQNENTRVCLFINKRIEKKTYTHTFHSKNLISLKLGIEDGRTLNIHNIYNPCKGSNEPNAIPSLRRALEENPAEEHIVLGDLNLHHSSWGGAHVRADAEAYEFIVVMESNALKRVTPTGLITWSRHESQSTIDLTYVTPLLRNSIIETGIAEDMDNHSDHHPIKTILNLQTRRPEPRATRNWKKTEVEVLIKELQANIDNSSALTPLDGEHNNQTEDIDQQIKDLTEAMQTAIEKSTPFCKPSKYAKPGFTEECKLASRNAKAARKRYQESGRTDYYWEQYKKARNKLGHVVLKAMRNQFRTETEARCDTPESMWKACKWARNRTPKEACLPALHDHPPMLPESDSAKKAGILLRKFFPPPPTVDLSDIQGATYNQDLTIPDIQLHEVSRAIMTTVANKAPGEDGITNRVLKWTNETIAPHLQRIFNASLAAEYCPERFRRSVTIALRKPQRESYSVASSYRPIALLNTISKIMEFILAKRISYLAETHDLLPRTHFGARKSVSTEHALHFMVERIYAAWNKGLISTAMLLDVTGAFDNIARLRLLHNLRVKRLDERLVRWIDAYLSGRMTILKTGEYVTEWLKITVGTPQRSPLSPILFLFYNAPLLEALASRGIFASGFVDDIGLLVGGRSAKENNDTLVKAHEEVCVTWAKAHGVKFAPSKYQLCHFSRKRSEDVAASIKLPEMADVIKARKEVKYLGVMMDTKLNWKAQVGQNKTKALKSIGALASLSGTTWGAKLVRMRQMMQAVFISQLTYACSVWYTPQGEKGHLKGVVNGLASIQYRAERVITGAYKATSKEALNIEINSLPMHLRLDRLTSTAATSLITSPAYPTIIQGRSTRTSRLRSTLR